MYRQPTLSDGNWHPSRRRMVADVGADWRLPRRPYVVRRRYLWRLVIAVLVWTWWINFHVYMQTPRDFRDMLNIPEPRGVYM